jgi:endonuclease YncB( thermonuclease family)
MAQRSGSKPIRALRGLALLIPALGVAACMAQPRAAPAQLRGTPQVISGDLIELEGQRLRLAGIDAPEPGQRCLLRERLYDCGALARAALLDLTAGVEVICRPLEPGPAATLTARCSAQGYDLSEGMVYTGWALIPPAVGTTYAAQQAQAKAAGHGLWRGRFVTPWDWVRGERLPEESGG